MAIKWTKESRNAPNSGTIFKGTYKGTQLGKLVYDGGYTLMYFKGGHHDYLNEADLIEAIEKRKNEKGSSPGSYTVSTFDEDNQSMTGEMVRVKAKSDDEAARLGTKKLKLEENGYQGPLIVTDHKGKRVLFRLEDNAEYPETSGWWRKPQ